MRKVPPKESRNPGDGKNEPFLIFCPPYQSHRGGHRIRLSGTARHADRRGRRRRHWCRNVSSILRRLAGRNRADFCTISRGAPLPRFGTSDNGLSDVSTIDIKASGRSHRPGRAGSETFPKTATYCHLLPFGAAKPLRPFQPVHFFTCPSRACRPAWAPG
jgi:hypothetical protein